MGAFSIIYADMSNLGHPLNKLAEIMGRTVIRKAAGPEWQRLRPPYAPAPKVHPEAVERALSMPIFGTRKKVQHALEQPAVPTRSDKKAEQTEPTTQGLNRFPWKLRTKLPLSQKCRPVVPNSKWSPHFIQAYKELRAHDVQLVHTHQGLIFRITENPIEEKLLNAMEDVYFMAQWEENRQRQRNQKRWKKQKKQTREQQRRAKEKAQEMGNSNSNDRDGEMEDDAALEWHAEWDECEANKINQRDDHRHRKIAETHWAKEAAAITRRVKYEAWLAEAVWRRTSGETTEAEIRWIRAGYGLELLVKRGEQEGFAQPEPSEKTQNPPPTKPTEKPRQKPINGTTATPLYIKLLAARKRDAARTITPKIDVKEYAAALKAALPPGEVMEYRWGEPPQDNGRAWYQRLVLPKLRWSQAENKFVEQAPEPNNQLNPPPRFSPMEVSSRPIVKRRALHPALKHECDEGEE